MCLAMDANRALSQLSYRPKSALVYEKYLQIEQTLLKER